MNSYESSYQWSFRDPGFASDGSLPGLAFLGPPVSPIRVECSVYRSFRKRHQ